MKNIRAIISKLLMVDILLVETQMTPPNQEIQIQEDSKLTDAEEGEIGSYNLSTSLYLVPEVYATAKSLNPNSTPPLPPTQVINLPTKEKL